ncbi:MAG: putative rane protein [Fibrobacterota bacterium]|jgi:RND superfamily putative drug exporter
MLRSLSASRLLHSLGTLSSSRPWLVLLLWVVILGAALFPARDLPQRLGSGNWTVENSPSDTTARLLQSRFDDPWSRSLVLVASPAPEDLQGTQLRKALANLRAACLKIPGVVRVAGPDDLPDSLLNLPAPKGALLLVGFQRLRSDSLVDEVRALADSLLQAQAPQCRWNLTGPAVLSVDFSRFSEKDTSRAEGRALPVTALLLLLVFGSLWRLGIPLLVGVIASTLTLGAAWILSIQGMSLSILLQSVASMLGLALGIDYALLLVCRYQELRQAGEESSQAAALAVSTSGRAICESALAVTIGLGALLWTPLSETRSIGMAGCVVAFLAALGALTLAPALLVLLDRHVRWPRRRTATRPWLHRPEFWTRWALRVTRHPSAFLALGLGLMLPLSLPGLSSQSGFPPESFNPPGLGYQMGLKHLDSLNLGSLAYPVELVIERTDGQPVLGDSKGIEVFVQKISELHTIEPQARILGPLSNLAGLPPEKARFAMSAIVSQGIPPELARQFLSRDGKAVLLRILAPPGWGVAQTRPLVRALKQAPCPSGFRIHAGGLGAYYEDFDPAMTRLFLPLSLAVGLCTFLVLALLFRSVLVPLKAILLNLLSVGAGYGAVVWVFQLGHGATWLGLPGATGVIPVTVPVLLFCIVFGLSMDYEVFLVSRMREGIRKGMSNEQAVIDGIATTGSVVTGAAAIMVAVFGAFALSQVYLVQMLGVGLAVAVFLDATVVRMLLVPSLMSLAGRWNWWPGNRSRSQQMAP